MLKDVGMTVPKSRETSAVYSYMQQHGGMRAVAIIIYAARQGMRAVAIIIYAAGQGMRAVYMQQDKG